MKERPSPPRAFTFCPQEEFALVIDRPDRIALLNNGYFYEGRKSLFPEVLIMDAY